MRACIYIVLVSCGQTSFLHCCFLQTDTQPSFVDLGGWAVVEGAYRPVSIFNPLLFNLESDEATGTTLVWFFNSADRGGGCQ